MSCIPCVFIEVLRDSRTKESSAGQAFSDGEKAGWQKQVCELLRDAPDENPVKRRRRLADASWKVERLATLDWLRCIESGLRWGSSTSLADFDHSAAVEAAVENAEGGLDFPDGTPLTLGGIPRVLVLVSDQQSTQTCGIHFLQQKLKLLVAHWPDPCHMCWNDITEGITKAGFMGSVQCAMCVFNVAYGPFQKSAFFSDLRNAAADISSNMSSEDSLLLRLWPSICKDAGWREPSEQGADARARWLESLPSLEVASVKGPRASLSRWFSVQSSIRFWDKQWHAKLVLILWVALRKSWAKSLNEILVPSKSSLQSAVQIAEAPDVPCGVDGPAYVSATEGAPGDGKAASSSSGAGMAEKTSSAAKGSVQGLSMCV
eukprot:6458613-Amphidinium_carterae.3